eukprot:1145112-Pelagomonas_calceolata.AAC.10
MSYEAATALHEDQHHPAAKTVLKSCVRSHAEPQRWLSTACATAHLHRLVSHNLSSCVWSLQWSPYAAVAELCCAQSMGIPRTKEGEPHRGCGGR